MKHEPRPAIHIEKSLLAAWVGLYVGWDGASGDLWCGKNSVFLASLIESQIWHLSAGSVALLGEGSEKGQWRLPTFLSGRKLSASSHLDARHFGFSQYATGTQRE